MNDKHLDLFAKRSVLADLMRCNASKPIIYEYQRAVIALEEALD